MKNRIRSLAELQESGSNFEREIAGLILDKRRSFREAERLWELTVADFLRTREFGNDVRLAERAAIIEIQELLDSESSVRGQAPAV